MKVNYYPADLIGFEDEIAALFAEKRVHAPVHLAGGNEEQLIRVFQEHVEEQDWVLGGWRMHYHCLLKGVPPGQLRQAILDGKSISLCFPEHRILSSGIVGGVAPIAVGLAMGIKIRGKQEAKIRGCLPPAHERCKVVCFLGDMTAETGIVHESIKYAVNHDLPVLFVIEDNGLSVSTNTLAVWGVTAYRWNFSEGYSSLRPDKVVRYSYKLTRPHVGIGMHIAF